MDICPARIDVLVSRQHATGKCRKVDTKWKKKLSDKIGQFDMKRKNTLLFCKWSSEKQYPVSTMQKTGCTNHSSFLVKSGLEKGFTLDLITRGQSTTIFLCIGPFSAWWRQTNKQPWNPSARLLLTGEKAVFCNFREQELSFCRHLVDGSSVGSVEANRAFQCVHQLLNSLVSPRALKHWLFISKNLPHLKEERTWWGSWFAGALLSIGGRKTPEEAAGWPAPTIISWTWDKRYPHSTVHQYCFYFTTTWTWENRYPRSISIVDNSQIVFVKWRPSLARLSSSDLSPLRPPDMLSCTWQKYVFFDRAIDVKLHWAYH